MFHEISMSFMTHLNLWFWVLDHFWGIWSFNSTNISKVWILYIIFMLLLGRIQIWSAILLFRSAFARRSWIGNLGLILRSPLILYIILYLNPFLLSFLTMAILVGQIPGECRIYLLKDWSQIESLIWVHFTAFLIQNSISFTRLANPWSSTLNEVLSMILGSISRSRPSIKSPRIYLLNFLHIEMLQVMLIGYWRTSDLFPRN